MWAFGCGVVSSGMPILSNWPLLIAGIALSGPLVCGTSQAINDWYDRHVDAINEPNRPIPSGRIPGRWGLYIAIAWSIVSLIVAALIGPWVFYASVFGLAAAWAYSMPPFRLKANGWWGNSAVGLCYEGLPWFTGAAALLGGLPDWPILSLALLYSLGAHGIMTLNDFKAIEGDSRMGVRSLPVLLGADGAARVASAVMAVPQVVGIARLGLVQSALGAIVVLTTSTINRVMIVELALPAMVPGLLVTLHYALQVLRPSWGHGSGTGGRRTPWIIAGMLALALGGFGAAVSVHMMTQNLVPGLIAATIAFTFIGGGVGAAGTSLLVLLAKSVDETRRGGGHRLDVQSGEFRRTIARRRADGAVRGLAGDCLRLRRLRRRHAGGRVAACAGLAGHGLCDGLRGRVTAVRPCGGPGIGHRQAGRFRGSGQSPRSGRAASGKRELTHA